MQLIIIRFALTMICGMELHGVAHGSLDGAADNYHRKVLGQDVELLWALQTVDIGLSRCLGQNNCTTHSYTSLMA